MQYRILKDARAIRKKFVDNFLLPFEDFYAVRPELAGRYDEAYYARMYMWDRFIPESKQISFAEALTFLKARDGEVCFLTEEPECIATDFCQLDKQKRYVAAASPAELAELAAYEWFTEYELAEQGCCLAEPVLPSDFYVFDGSFRWCLVFTHETDWNEKPESRVCFLAKI